MGASVFVRRVLDMVVSGWATAATRFIEYGTFLVRTRCSK